MNRRLLLGGLGLGSLAAAMPAWAAGSVKLPLPGGPDVHFARPTGNEIHAKLCPRPAECKT